MFTPTTTNSENEINKAQAPIRIDSDLYQRLRKEAIRERLPMARVVNRIIQRHLDQQAA